MNTEPKTFTIGSTIYTIEKMFKNNCKVVGMFGADVKENTYHAVAQARSPKCRKAKTFNLLVNNGLVINAKSL